MSNKIYYSEKYQDDEFEYRHVHLPKEMVKLVPKQRLMSETEWRSIGIQQSPGWIHYLIHAPEPHIILFKRPLSVAAAQAAAQAQSVAGMSKQQQKVTQRAC